MWKDFFYFTKTERQGIIVLVVLVIGTYAIPRLLQAFSQPEKTNPAEQVKAEKEQFVADYFNISNSGGVAVHSTKVTP